MNISSSGKLMTLIQSRFFHDIVKVFTSNIIVLIFSFLTGIVLARVLGVEKNGEYALIMVVPNLIVSISQLGIRQALVYLIGQNRYESDKIIGNVVSLYFLTSLLGAIACFCILFTSYSQVFSNYTLILAASIVPFALINSYVSGIYLGKEKIGISTTFNWLPQTLRFLFVIILVVVLNLSIDGALIAYLIALIPVGVLAIYKLSKEYSLRVRIDREITEDLLKLGFVYALAVFVNSLNYRIDVLLLSELSVLAEVGLYNVAVNFAELLLQIPTAIGLVIFSRSSNSKKPKSFSANNIKLLISLIVIAALGAILLYFLSPFIIPIIYSLKYEGSVKMLQLLLPGVIGLTAYKIIGFDLAGKGKPWVSIIASVPGLFVNVVLNYLLIPELGGRGAALASSVSYITMGIIHWIAYKKILQKYSNES